MKILLIDNASLTPVNSALCCEPKTGEFAKELQALGNEVTMYGQIVESENIHAFNIQENGINVVGHHRRKLKIFNYILLYLLIIPQIFKSDFIYIFYPSAFKYISILCFIFNKPYGLYVRGEMGLKNGVSSFIYKKAYKVFTVTDYFTTLINSLSKSNIAETIRPMINLNEKDIMPVNKKNISGIFKVLFLARLEEDKGVKEILYAIYKLKKMDYNLKLILVGDGGYKKEAMHIIDKLDISDFVELKGAIYDIDKVKNMYLDSNVYILPTYHEGFPRTLYEAMIFGTPIITTFVGGIPYLMRDKFNCVQIKVKSVESIVNALIYSINNHEKMLDYAKNAQTTVKPIINSTRLSHAEALHNAIHNI
ncbi:glycosyltransferase family 4 protein [Acinetobacter indicus]|uniref:glycosyltransferase family 4 protein n=1 Tax=Acinetobacter indicus TaxID=756892 RepID=UPI00131571E2|nr:glycosyltransferase family 4 protein [Acinetobacter indicus]